jgi:amino acid permease
MYNRTLVEWMKIITNIILIIVILIGLFVYINYNNQVEEALNLKKPTTLISLYENATGEYCLCYDNPEDICYTDSLNFK